MPPESFAIFDVRVVVADPSAPGSIRTKCLWFSYLTLLLVTVLAQTLFAFVGSDFVSFTFFSARHIASKVMKL